MKRLAKWAVTACALLALSLAAAPAAQAEGFTSADLLAQSKEGQESFIEISLTMAAAIAAQTNPGIAECLDGWYFRDRQRQAARVAHIQATMRQYPAYHPSGVVLAVVQQTCGSFGE